MRPFRACLNQIAIALLTLALSAVVSFAASTETTLKKPAAHHAARSHTSHKGKKSKKTASRKRGQQKIDSDRARQIQEALIREHYLSGKASGTWDAASQQAMQKYQADNGWQSKNTPDSRALIKLGLGPDQQHLLNPESAMTSAPAAPVHAAPATEKAPNSDDPPQPQE